MPARQQGRERPGVKAPLGRAKVAMVAGGWAAHSGQRIWTGGTATPQRELNPLPPQTLKVSAVTQGELPATGSLEQAPAVGEGRAKGN